MYGTLEEPLFLAKDVAEWIEHSNTSSMLNSIDEDEKLTLNITYSEENGNIKAHNVCFLTEDGLYEVLMQSRKPIAKQFKKEVKRILKELRLKGEAKIEPVASQKTELEIRNETRQLVNEAKRLKLEEAAYWTKLAEKYSHNKDYSQILDAYSTKALEGEWFMDKSPYSAKQVESFRYNDCAVEFIRSKLSE